MDIGTAKLPASERRGIRHHLLDTLDGPRAGDGRGVPGLGARGHRATCAARARRRCWSAARRSTPARSSTGSTSRAPTRRSAPGWEAELAERSDRRRSTHGSSERDPEAPPRDPPRERPPHRPRPRGDRADRPAVHGQPARVLEYVDAHTVQIGVDIDRADPRRADRRAGRRDVRQRLRRRGASACSTRAWPSGRTASRAIGYREVVAAPARRAHRAGGPRADRDGHPAVRAPAGLVVPQGPADRLGRARRPRAGRQGAAIGPVTGRLSKIGRAPAATRGARLDA